MTSFRFISKLEQELIYDFADFMYDDKEEFDSIYNFITNGTPIRPLYLKSIEKICVDNDKQKLYDRLLEYISIISEEKS